MSLYRDDVPIDIILLGAELQEIIDKLLTERERELFYCYFDNPRRKPNRQLLKLIDKIRQLHEQRAREVVYGYQSTEPSVEPRNEG